MSQCLHGRVVCVSTSLPANAAPAPGERAPCAPPARSARPRSRRAADLARHLPGLGAAGGGCLLLFRNEMAALPLLKQLYQTRLSLLFIYYYIIVILLRERLQNSEEKDHM